MLRRCLLFALTLLVGVVGVSLTAKAQVAPRIIIAFDTSGSMAESLTGVLTFGDGVLDNCSPRTSGSYTYECGANCTAGIDTDCNGQLDDSRIYVAKAALRKMILAYGDVDWALARFHQTEGTNESCLNINGYECNTFGPYVTSYGNPQCNTGSAIPSGGCPFNWPSLWPAACAPGTSIYPDLRTYQNSGGPRVCVNYAGTCSGGDVLVGFPGSGAFTAMSNVPAILSWLDGHETSFDASTTTGNFCNAATTGDCELRPGGPTPLGGLLTDIGSYIAPIRGGDSKSSCRPYSVILLTDGAESCGGNPVGAATTLRSMGVLTYVVGVAIDSASRTELNDIATAGGTDAGSAGGDTAFFADDPVTLSEGLSEIVQRSLLVETCNGLDDDCDGIVDEGFTKYCNRPGGVTTQSLCTDPGETVCDGLDDNCNGLVDEGLTNACGTCGPVPTEACNGIDDDCDGVIDEGGVCSGCVPSAEICDGADNDCDGLIDESLTRPCGTDVGQCTTGTETCTTGTWGACSGVGPSTEVCDGVDNDCDGIVDGITRPCGSSTGACQSGTELCTSGTWGTCTGSIGPSTEVCDGVDNNCNGSVDEGNPGGGGACGSSIGACSPGSVSCVGGMLTCVGGTSASPETCNGIDDDCNGVVDDGVPSMGPCGSSTGTCSQGALQCVGGSFTCVGGRGPTTEVCDGLDNDCDGSVDEGNPGGGSPCGTATGACALGTSACVGGALVCSGGTGPTPETCDGIDNDCDGLVDEGNPGGGAPCGMSSVGACEDGALACVGGSLTCVGATGPRPEICDGIDNDCDGMIDEGNPEGGAPCGDDTGECTPGTTLCTGGTLVCSGAVGPTPEICDGLDNDCDGVADDGIPVGAPCGTDTGECSPGRNVCMGGALVCEGAIGPTDEVCDGLDDDCDGMVDEGLPVGAPCGTDVGVCMAGVEQCVDGRSLCVGGVPPGREACDCLDNNCDGNVDEPPSSGTLCPSGSTCVDCQCAVPCQMSEFGFTCPSGRAPEVQPSGDCYCVHDRCDDAACATETHPGCAPGDPTLPTCVCNNNDCTFPCDGVVCMDGLVCNPNSGRCVQNDCNGLGCPTGQRCNMVSGSCEADPCATVTCPSGQACREGTCIGSCATVTCPSGQVCHDGSCVGDPCASVHCTAGQVCDPSSGSCTANLCRGTTCRSGEVCDPLTGDCGADPCADLHCPGGQQCVSGECVSASPPDAGVDAGHDAGTGGPTSDEHHRVLAAGGGGCTCTAAGAAAGGGPGAGGFGGLLALLLVLALAAVRLRGRGAGRLWRFFARAAVGSAGRRWRLLLLGSTALAVALLAAGCNVDPFCLDCGDGGVDAGHDAGPPDSGVHDAGHDAGPPDAGPADAGPDGCLADEICNGLDDDCDGIVDEGIDTSTDLNNCGGCGIVCAPPHAFASCTGGVCGVESCDVGYYDMDGDPTDGCEYHCLPTDPDDSICDLRDNDCDGMVDEDVALATDPMNCGSCGTLCRFAHVATAQCTGGTCTYNPATDCETGFYDIDGDPTNGCEYACTPSSPSDEVCDGLDNDCDGMIDEGDPGGGTTCGSSTGACTTGTEHCRMGTLVCEGAVAPTTESCNGVDDNCDGRTDEGNPGGGALCGPSLGTCAQGRMTCMGGTLTCVGATGPTTETCDGLDNDCDGMIDEGDPGGGGSCGSSTGACTAGTEHCRGGVVVCEGATGPVDETCNGVDDDCDGMVDEGNPGGGSTCGTDVGECSPGTRRCMAGTLRCIGATGATAETCDGLDNDCDGSIDEGNPGGGASCGTGIGACTAGSMQCLGGTLQCRGSTGPSLEVCNGADDDCDGMVDEDFDLTSDVRNCGSCGSTCSFAHATAECSSSTCAIRSCDTGYYDLDGNPANGCEYACSYAGAEVCNGVDDDCNGVVDDGLTPPSNFCNPNGVCAGTAATCGGSSGWQCSYPSTYESPEVSCDGLDNDCNGVTDDPYPLVGTSCSHGQGVCRRTGSYVCNATHDGLTCTAPVAGTPGTEVCNDQDDDCDGMVDERGPSPDGIDLSVIPTVTVAKSGGGTVKVMQYEASRADASSSAEGSVDGYACSNPNVLPWTDVTWQQAETACCGLNASGTCLGGGSGWRLCDAADWQTACEATSGTCTWSYATGCNTSHPTRCNGAEYDCDSGTTGTQNCLKPTGQFPACYADWGSGGGIYDMSGNVKEWTATQSGSTTVHEIRGGSYNNVEDGRTCGFDFTVGGSTFSFPNTGFRCCYY